MLGRAAASEISRNLIDAGRHPDTPVMVAVNDSLPTLSDLSARLFAAGALPYYLHQLDRVAGTAHFEVSDELARSLHEGLAASLPGYLVPRLVREVAGAPAKTPL